MKTLIPSDLEPYAGSYVSELHRDGRVTLPKPFLDTSMKRHSGIFSHDAGLELALLLGYVPKWYVGGKNNVSLFSASDLAHTDIICGIECAYYFPRILSSRHMLNVNVCHFDSRLLRFTGRGDYISISPVVCKKI